MSLSLLTAFLLTPALAPQIDRIFSCSLGTKQVEVTGTGDTVTYRFGRPGKPEMTLSGSTDGGVFYHRELYARGEDQTLRFVGDGYDYVVFNRWQAPFQKSDGSADPEINVSGMLIMKDGKLVRRLACKTGGDFREWPIFKKLKQDEGNLVPDDAG